MLEVVAVARLARDGFRETRTSFRLHCGEMPARGHALRRAARDPADPSHECSDARAAWCTLDDYDHARVWIIVHPDRPGRRIAGWVTAALGGASIAGGIALSVWGFTTPFAHRDETNPGVIYGPLVAFGGLTALVGGIALVTSSGTHVALRRAGVPLLVPTLALGTPKHPGAMLSATVAF